MKSVFIPLIILGTIFPATFSKADPAARPAHCQSFDISSFDALDTDHDGFLSESEFQVHRDQMHGPGVPPDCHIPYDKTSYQRLVAGKGMTKAEFAVHLREMDVRAAQAR